jgi:hypothetical protein
LLKYLRLVRGALEGRRRGGSEKGRGEEHWKGGGEEDERRGEERSIGVEERREEERRRGGKGRGGESLRHCDAPYNLPSIPIIPSLYSLCRPGPRSESKSRVHNTGQPSSSRGGDEVGGVTRDR